MPRLPTMSPRLSFLTDLVIFQVAWFGCVLATRSPFPHLLPILVLLLVLVRVLLTRGLAQALPFTLACLILGVVGDATLVHLGLLSFEPYPSLFGPRCGWLPCGLILVLCSGLSSPGFSIIAGDQSLVFQLEVWLHIIPGKNLVCLPSALTFNPTLEWPWNGPLPDSSYATYISNFHYPNEYA